ncbi:MAG: glycoside hydrolase family 2 TIM barrel-domain containing protein [Ignavibacteria bacterium]|nr:glycoside hydrolase family 2 TIM barrel-domain containing protein [Ignavibacteria bacterium]
MSSINNIIRTNIVFLIVFIWQNYAVSQISIFERKPTEDNRNRETLYESATRNKIDLNGDWQAVFDNSNNINLYVPFATDYEGSFLLNRNFSIPDSLLNNFTFLFVAEGINFDSEVKLNNIIISRNSGGLKLILTEIQENIVQKNNTISILVTNKPDNSRTLPLALQNNYSKNYTGITANIYMLAVPKLYINDFLSDYTFENDNFLKFTNTVHINTNLIDSITSSAKSFYLKTEVLKKSSLEKIAESPSVRFEAGNYQTYSFTNELVIRNPESWSPEKPELYIIKTIITGQDKIIDELYSETGFVNMKISGSDISINSRKIKLNGINYYEDLPKYADALEFSAVEKDLMKIKDYGFNCIRIPGKSAHPFVVKICQRIGLFLLEEIPFNEVPESLLKSDKYRKSAVEYAENIVRRDKHSPSVLFWGIGNDFDVTCKQAETYARQIKDAVNALDNRKIYYTTRNISNDLVENIADIKGLNLSNEDLETIKNRTEKTERNKFIFISGIGVAVNNNNRNGFGDNQSVEYQAKLLTESFKSLNRFPGIFVNSFADYNSECPLLIHYNSDNYYMQTNGLFDFNREPKYTAGIFKKLLNNQGFQKIPEGTEEAEKQQTYIFLITGLAFLLLFVLALGKISYFKENILKSLIAPKNFLHQIKEQSPVSNYQNFIVLLFISLSLSLYFSSILFYLRADYNFDILLSKISGDGYVKMFLVDVINKPAYLLLFVILLFSVYIAVITSLVYVFSAFSKRSTKFRSVFTVISWSNVSMLVFLAFGIIFSKTLSYGMLLNLSFYFFLLLLTYCLFKIINGIRYIYEYNAFKTYFYGTLVILVLGGLSYFYFVIYSSALDFLYLIRTFN